MTFSNMFKENHIIEQVTGAEKRAVIEEMLNTAVKRGVCPKTRKKAIFEALMEREKLGSTGLGHGVAIPHVKIEGLQCQISMLARSTEGVDFNAVDGEPVHIFFLLISSSKSSEEHLSILQWISRMARHQDFSNFIRKAKDGKEIYSIIKEFSE